MPYEYMHAIQKVSPTTLQKNEIGERSPAVNRTTCSIFSYYKMGEEERRKITSSQIIKLDSALCSLKSSHGMPWQETSSTAMLFEKIDTPLKSDFFSNVDSYIKGFPIEDPQILSQTDKALGSLYGRIKALAEGFFCNIRSIPPSRAPGFVIDGWIIIPENDRDLEYKIYRELGNVIRNNPNLLFNIHIIARKGRELNKIVPENYKRYNIWSGYVC